MNVLLKGVLGGGTLYALSVSSAVSLLAKWRFCKIFWKRLRVNTFWIPSSPSNEIYSKVYSKNSFHFLGHSEKVPPRLLCINVCLTNKQRLQNITVDTFFIFIKWFKIFRKVMFCSFFFPFALFVVLSSSSAFNKWWTLASGNNKMGSSYCVLSVLWC